MFEFHEGDLAIVVHFGLLEHLLHDQIDLLFSQLLSRQTAQRIVQIVHADVPVVVHVVDLEGVKCFQIPRRVLRENVEHVHEVVESYMTAEYFKYYIYLSFVAKRSVAKIAKRSFA